MELKKMSRKQSLQSIFLFFFIAATQTADKEKVKKVTYSRRWIGGTAEHGPWSDCRGYRHSK